MQFKENVLKDASAVILLKNSEVFLAKRNPKVSFLGGWHAFPGGKIDTGDAEIEVRNCKDKDLAKFIACAVRETFEETGILLVRNGDKMTKGQRNSLLDDLMSGRSSFAEILAHWELWIDAEDFSYTGFWTTPPISPVRFKTRFFIANCPPKQDSTTEGELVEGKFLTPENALNLWKNGEVIISPPVLIALQELAGNSEDCRNKVADSSATMRLCAETLLKKSQACDGEIDFIELNPHIICFSLKTETLPPATHTNCFVVGKKEFIVIDAASKEDSEQKKLHAFVDSLIENGCVCKEIIVTHLHPDHFGGETALQKHLQEKFNLQVPVSAHKLTAESLQRKVEFQKFIEDGEALTLRDEDGKEFKLQTLHTPGHARGHLCFYDKKHGFLLSSDNVISASSVVIAPPEGNMSDYLHSLEQLKNLPNLRFLCGSHGAAVYDAKAKIEAYIQHRLKRERKIIDAIENGAKNIKEIVSAVYTDVAPNLLHLAELSVKAHLEKIEENKIKIEGV